MKAERHLFLLSGQANMAGRGDLGTEDQTPHPRVLAFSVANEWELAIEPLSGGQRGGAGVGPGLAFGKAMARHEPEVFIGLVPCAMSGGTLKQWQRGGELYFQTIHRARLAMRDGVLKGILWHHGETETGQESVARSYGDWLARLIEDLRRDLAAPGLPFVVGQLGEFLFEPPLARSPYAGVINQSLAQLPRQVPAMACVSSKGLGHRGDHIHFDSAAQRELGRRYANELARLMGN